MRCPRTPPQLNVFMFSVLDLIVYVDLGNSGVTVGGMVTVEEYMMSSWRRFWNNYLDTSISINCLLRIK